MIIPKITLPQNFTDLPIKSGLKSLQNTNISAFSLTTVALAANENLIDESEIHAINRDNLKHLYEKSLTQLKKHIHSFDSPMISLSLASKTSGDNIDFDEVSQSLGLYFIATFEGLMSIDFCLNIPVVNAKTKRAQKILSLLALRMENRIPSQSANSLVENTLEYELYESFILQAKKLAITPSPENFLKHNRSNDLGISNLQDAQAFFKSQSWYNRKLKSVSKKTISREIKKLNHHPLADCLTQIHEELESLIQKFRLHCDNHFGVGEEVMTHNNGLFIYGGFPEEVMIIDDEINMMNQVCEPIEEVFYPNKKLGLTSALDYFASLQLFCNNTQKALKPFSRH